MKMKLGKWITHSVLALVAATLLSFTAQAQAPKIATIDLKKVFDNYWKTKQADANLKERAADLDKTRKGMMDDYQAASEDYRKLMESANEQAVSADERDKRKKAAEAKLLDIKAIENEVSQFDRQSRTTLAEQQRRMRDNILREIRDLIDSTSKAESFTLVIDVAAETPNQTPVVLFSNGANDLTDKILTQMNANAPAGSLTAPAPAEEKK